MEEKYSKLFSMRGNLYVEGSPVIVSAGALVKDNSLGNIIAQLKFLNISNKHVIAVKVKFCLFDVAGNVLMNDMEYQYLDFNAARNASFGDRTAVILKEKRTRSFSVIVTEVVFEDKSVWRNARQPETIPVTTLDAALDEKWDGSIIHYYKRKYGKDSCFFPEVYKDIWICKCGTINHEDEANCYACGIKRREIIDDFDKNVLLKEYEEEKQKQQKEAEEQAKKWQEEEAAKNRLKREMEEKKRIIRRRKLIASSIVCGMISIIIVIAVSIDAYDQIKSQKNLDVVWKDWKKFEDNNPLDMNSPYEYNAHGTVRSVEFEVNVNSLYDYTAEEKKEYLERLDAMVEDIDECRVTYKIYSDGKRYWLEDGEVHSEDRE